MPLRQVKKRVPRVWPFHQVKNWVMKVFTCGALRAGRREFRRVFAGLWRFTRDLSTGRTAAPRPVRFLANLLITGVAHRQCATRPFPGLSSTYRLNAVIVT